MISKFDYNSEDVMNILNSPDYNDEQKKQLFEKYKTDLKASRKKEIISRVNELAQKIPVITEDIYVSFLKNYEEDNLSKPFETIEKEIKEFEVEMTEKYNAYLESKKQDETPKEEEITPDVSTPVQEETNDELANDFFNAPLNENIDDTKIEPTLVLGENSVLNEEPEILAKPLFEDSNDEGKDVLPSSVSDTLGEKGNASAIILSIIAIIVGAVVMYTIIKFN